MSEKIPTRQSSAEQQTSDLIERLLMAEDFPRGERLRNLPLFLRQKDLAHILFISDLYRRVLNIPGYIAEFGVMWGRNLNLLLCLRECFEPYNHTRRILGFDTFTGFIETGKEDTAVAQNDDLHATGTYATSQDHEQRLADLLSAQENVSHLAHLRRHEIVKGDVTKTLPAYIGKNPHALFALCYLDLDLYQPTKAVLSQIRGRLVRGAILVFDEVLNPDYPGETKALLEEFDLARYGLRRDPLSGWKTYIEIS
jgi:hypothetical protein